MFEPPCYNPPLCYFVLYLVPFVVSGFIFTTKVTKVDTKGHKWIIKMLFLRPYINYLAISLNNYQNFSDMDFILLSNILKT